jgi:heme exporter protein D
MNTTNPSPHLDPAVLTDRVTAAVSAHRIKLRLLTGVAFLFGFLTVAASVLFVCFYLILYLPKQKQILRDAENIAQQARTDSAARAESVPEAIQRIDKFLGVQITLTHVVSLGTTMIAVVVGILGLGTLVLLSVVLLHRRVALHQIEASLAQISTQFRELQVQSSGSGTPGQGRPIST